MKQNANEMKTVVETFIIEETAELIYDNESLDKWNNLIKDLGLKGQECLVKTDKSPIPFMHLKTSLENVFITLCPIQVEVEAYNATPIPVEILDLVALSKREGYFNKIQVWYDDKDPDPVVVGITGHWYQPDWHDDRVRELDGKKFSTVQEAREAGAKSVYFTEKNKYILGKWADVKRPLTELKKMAYDRYLLENGAKLRKEIKETQRKLDDLEIDAVERFN